MINKIFEITENRALTKDVWEMIIKSDESGIDKPGQFINIKLDGFYLRRPISVCDYDETIIKIIYKIVGNGTQAMSDIKPGESIDVLTGLGNGFDTAKSAQTPLVIGGGVGVPPMYNLTKKLISEGKTPTVILGFNTKDEIFYEDEFKSLGVKTIVTTADGSYGIRGFVTDAIKAIPSYSYFFACGPIPMLRAVNDISISSGQLSFEERMGCGFGACMGCSCKTLYGNKRICKEGPVLEKEEIIWEA